jgi:hypothetical protein
MLSTSVQVSPIALLGAYIPLGPEVYYTLLTTMLSKRGAPFANRLVLA